MTLALLVVLAVSLFALSIKFPLLPVYDPEAETTTWDGRTLTPNQVYNRVSLRNVMFLWSGLGLPRSGGNWSMKRIIKWLLIATAIAGAALLLATCTAKPAYALAFAPMMLPPARPEITRDDALKLAGLYSLPDDKVFLLGRRGYYRDTMGKSGENDIDIYDDAICIVTPNRCIPYNANTDPSKHHPGVALLQPGRWPYRLGIHGITHANPYPALVQAGAVIVKREGTADIAMEDTDRFHPKYGMRLGARSELWKGDFFAINIHKGSRETTSSEGCQTIHPSQWGDFYEKVKSTMSFYQMSSIPYILTERT